MILAMNTYRPDEACSETDRSPSDQLDRSEGSLDSSEQYDERERYILIGFPIAHGEINKRARRLRDDGWEDE